MSGQVPQPAFVPCSGCGASVPTDGHEQHVCDPDQRSRYEAFRVRLEIERFDGELKSWLGTAEGRFAMFYAARERRAA
jgi:hypothetical protein